MKNLGVWEKIKNPHMLPLYLILLLSFIRSDAFLVGSKTRVDPSSPVYQFVIENDWLVMKGGVRLSGGGITGLRTGIQECWRTILWLFLSVRDMDQTPHSK